MDLDLRITALAEAIGQDYKELSKPSWMDIITGATSRTEIGSTVDGTVWQLNMLNTTTLYRLVPTNGDPALDNIYQDWDGTTLSNLYQTRTI